MRVNVVNKVLLILGISVILTGCSDRYVIIDTSKVDNKDTLVYENKEITEVSLELFQYIYLEDNTIAISGYSGNLDHVVLPSIIEGKEVTIIKECAFANHNEITSLVIPDTVKEIEDNAFTNCPNIKTIDFGEGIKKIGDYVFDANLKCIYLPEGIEEIGECSFSNLSNIKALSIPHNLHELKGGTFMGCGIEDLVIPGNIKSIGQQSFYGCSNLKNVTIENGVRRIYSKAFGDCKILHNVSIPSSVTYIEEDAFLSCEKMTIYTPMGSYAEIWAKENGVPCTVYKTR